MLAFWKSKIKSYIIQEKKRKKNVQNQFIAASKFIYYHFMFKIW